MIDDSTKEDIRKRTDLFELCEALGLDPNQKGKVARCPAHADQGRPNLHIYADNVHCFACNWGGDAFELVAKVKGCDFPTAFDFLAGRLGLPLIQDLRKSGPKKGRGLGNDNELDGLITFPKPSPLPSTPSPTLTPQSVEGLGNGAGDNGATVYPKPPAADWPPDDYTGPAISRINDTDSPVMIKGFAGVMNGERYFYTSGGNGGLPAAQLLPAPAADHTPDLPPELWQSFDNFAGAWVYWEACKGYRRALGKEGDRYVVGAAVVKPVEPAVERPSRRPSLRVEVFAALLDLATPSSATAAGDWLRQEKGVELATQDRFGLRFLDDPATVAGELRDRFGVDKLQKVGIYGTQKDGAPYFVFAKHRLLFPFYWKGEPVDVQGRDIAAIDKNNRFRNTAGANPIPYNAAALLNAKKTGSKVFLCEGATDTLALAQSGRLVVGIVGTGGFKSAWLPYFEGLDVYLAFDADEAGRKAAKNVTKLFLDAGHRAPKIVRLPEGVKDVNQFFRSMAK